MVMFCGYMYWYISKYRYIFSNHNRGISASAAAAAGRPFILYCYCTYGSPSASMTLPPTDGPVLFRVSQFHFTIHIPRSPLRVLITQHSWPPKFRTPRKATSAFIMNLASNIYFVFTSNYIHVLY